MEERDIELLLANLPALPPGSKPYFAEAQRTEIIEYIKASFNCFTSIPGTPDSLRARGHRETLKSAFDTTLMALTPATPLEPSYPIIFDIINAATLRAAKEAKVNFVHSVFNGVPIQTIRDLPESDFSQKFAQSINLKKQIDAINTKLEFLFKDKAKLGAIAPNVKLELINCPSLNIEEAGYRIVASDIASGYSIHNFCLVSNLYNERPNNRLYSGELVFNLTHAEVIEMSRYTTDLSKWFNDFDNILSCLLGEDASNYTKTGQKPLSEIIKTEDQRRIAGLPPFIAPAVTDALRALPQDMVVVLAGQEAIDLTHHPKRDELRSSLEHMYAVHGLIDSKRARKTFIKDAGFEYVSLLSIANIEAIFDDLMAHAALESIAREMGFDSATNAIFLEILESSNISQAYQKYLFQKLAALPISNAAAVATKAQQLLGQSFESTINAVKTAYDSSIRKMLNDLTGLVLKPVTAEAIIEPTDAEKRVLLADVRAAGAPLYPTTEADIDKLCAALKTSAAYHASIPTFEEEEFKAIITPNGMRSLNDCIDKIAADLKRRIRNPYRFADDPNYGALPLNRALESFMAFVTRVYYQPKTQVTQESVNKGFKKLAELLMDTEMISGCAAGLWGRLSEILTTLVTSSDDQLEEIIINLKKDIADRVFLRELGAGYGSSHAYPYKQSLYQKLGLSRAIAAALPMAAADEAKFFSAFAREFTPGIIYKKCFDTFIDNFQAFARDGDEDRIYKLLQYLGFTENFVGDVSEADKAKLSREFKIDPTNAGSKWNISRFELVLPEYLIRRLKDTGNINNAHPAQLIFKASPAAAPALLGRSDAPAYAAPRAAGGFFGGGYAAPQAAAAYGGGYIAQRAVAAPPARQAYQGVGGVEGYYNDWDRLVRQPAQVGLAAPAPGFGLFAAAPGPQAVAAPPPPAVAARVRQVADSEMTRNTDNTAKG